MQTLGEVLEEAGVTTKQFEDVFYPNGLSEKHIRSITCTSHGMDRVNVRFRVGKDKANEFCRDILRKAEFKGKTIAEDGNDSILYSYKGKAIYLDVEERKRIITVNVYNEGSIKGVCFNFDEFRDEIIKVHEKKLNHLQRLHTKLLKEYHEINLDLNIEYAQLEKKIHMSKSQKVKDDSIKRQEEIRKQKMEQEATMKDIEQKIRMVSKSFIAIEGFKEEGA